MFFQFEKITSLIQVWCIENDLLRIWDDAYQFSIVLDSFFDFAYRAKEKLSRGEDVMQRKIETDNVMFSIWAVMYVTLVEIHSHVHILGSRPSFD
jgi:hypothetical protein